MCVDLKDSEAAPPAVPPSPSPQSAFRPETPRRKDSLAWGVCWRGLVGIHRSIFWKATRLTTFSLHPASRRCAEAASAATSHLLEDLRGWGPSLGAAGPNLERWGLDAQEASPEPRQPEVTSGKVSSLDISLPRLVLPLAYLLAFPN